MGWQEERERLLADTLAFVQSVAEIDTSPPIIPSPPAAQSPAKQSPSARSPALQPRRMSDIDIRREMQQRLDAFRNKQRFLEIEREAYYQQAMQRIRAVTEQWA
jgi:hypothetical protein